jgi:hypothetical protein
MNSSHHDAQGAGCGVLDDLRACVNRTFREYEYTSTVAR